MKRNLRTRILSFSIVFMISAVVLIFMFSTSVADVEEQDIESSISQFISQLPDDIPDFVKNILAEEGIDLEELTNDPELRREMREKVMENPEIREEFQDRAAEEGMREESSQEGSKDKQRSPNGDKPKGKGRGIVDKYYKSIVDNNLFRPLGWGGDKKRGPAFRIIGTVIAKGQKPKALIFEFAKNTTHYVAVGEKIGNATVESIDEKSVTLNQDGEEPLKLNIMQASPFLGGSAGGRGGGGANVSGGQPTPPKNVRGSKSGGEGPDKKIRERLEKMSREEREKFIQNMREERRRGRDGNSRGGERAVREVLRRR